MDLLTFERDLNSLKSSIEQTHGIARYPFRTLDNLQLLNQLLSQAQLDPAALLNAGRILDVGCGDGDLGFYFSSQGTPVDLLDFEETNQNKLAMARELARQLPGTHTVHNADVERGLGGLEHFYTIAIAFGLLYHLKNPFLFLGDLATRSSYAAVSTRIVDSALLPDHLASAYLVGDNELGTDNTNFWLFNSAGFARLAERSGWRVISRVRFGDKRAGDAAKHDAREALLLASKYSVFGNIRILDGLNRVEFESYRWTQNKFEIEIRQPIPGGAKLRLSYFLPEDWLSSHHLRIQHDGLDLKVEITAAREDCTATVTLPKTAGTLRLNIVCDSAVTTHGDTRVLGIVLRLNSPIPPLQLV